MHTLKFRTNGHLVIVKTMFWEVKRLVTPRFKVLLEIEKKEIDSTIYGVDQKVSKEGCKPR